MRRRRFRNVITLCQIFTFLTISILLSFGIFIYYIHFHHMLAYKQNEMTSVNEILYGNNYLGNYAYNYYSISKEEIKERVDKLFNNPRYNYNEVKLPYPTLGKTTFIIRLIEIDTTVDIDNYTFALTHELVHLTDVTACERYCNFTAFKILYESDFNYFKDVALRYADKDLKGNVSYNYSCAGYIEQYLKEKKEN